VALKEEKTEHDEQSLENSSELQSEFWDDLLGLMQEETVVPVLGSEILTVRVGGKSVPLYRLVAEKLLAQYDLNVNDIDSLTNEEGILLRPGLELNDAVWAISKKKNKRLQQLYRPVHDVLESVVTEHQESLLQPLKKIASIPELSIFVTTTCDNVLATALNQTRHSGQKETLEIEFAPNLSEFKQKDLPDFLSDDTTIVFYLFGKSTAMQMYAIHEEDMLEFIYKLQQVLFIKKMLREVRSRNLLFIGCPLSDWLGRLLVRISNEKRLTENRDKREFMVINPASTNNDLALFLKHYSHETNLLFSEPHAFIDELITRWSERNPLFDSKESKDSSHKTLKGSIFISYASQDYEAAHQLYEEIKSIAGEDIAFFDKSGGLEWGDDWEPVIMRAIKKCTLFIPLISTNTQKRANERPVFMREWFAAAKEDDVVLSGVKFILPTLIDEEISKSPTKQLSIPVNFRKKHFQHAIGGHLSEEMRKTLAGEIQKIRRANP